MITPPAGIISIAELYEGVFRTESRQAGEEGLARFLTGVVITDLKTITRYLA